MSMTTMRTGVCAAFFMIAGTGGAMAFGSGGGSSGEGDGHLRQEMQNPRYIEPSRYAYRGGYRRDDPGAEYEAYRRGYPIFGPWGSKYRY